VSAAIRYTVVNVSDSPQRFPVAVLLPNPQVPALKSKADVLSVSITQNGRREIKDIAGERRRFREEMDASQATHVRCSAATLDLASGEHAEIEMQYVMAKEEEDSENFETLYPSLEEAGIDPVIGQLKAACVNPQMGGDATAFLAARTRRLGLTEPTFHANVNEPRTYPESPPVDVYASRCQNTGRCAKRSPRQRLSQEEASCQKWKASIPSSYLKRAAKAPARKRSLIGTTT
jgi:hypothetical protein